MNNLLRRRWTPWLGVLMLSVAAPLVPWVSERNAVEPECEGIGFGCELAPDTIATINLWLYIAGLLLLAAVLLALEFVRRDWVTRARLGVVAVGGVLLWTVLPIFR